MDSPISERSLLTEDDWDLVQSSSEPPSSANSPLTVPASLVSDVEYQDLNPSDAEDQSQTAVHVDEDDERVNEALANSLSSTLEPLRLPLAAFSSLNLSSSLDTPSQSTALRLSFPDPLSPSVQITTSPLSSFEDINVPLHNDPVDLPQPNAEVVPEDVKGGEDALDPIVEAPIPIKAKEDLVDHVITNTFDNADRVWKSTVVNILTHPWATSIILSLLALILSSVVIQAHHYNVVMRPTPVTTPIIIPPVLPTTLSSINFPISTPTSIVLPLETPGAGPSKVAEKPLPTPVSRGATRHGCATPLPLHSYCPNIKGKGKEKQVEETPLLLDAPTKRSPSMDDMGFSHIKSMINLSRYRHLSHTELITLNFKQAIDLLLSHMIAQTNLLILDITSLAHSAKRTTEEMIVVADQLLCNAREKANALYESSHRTATDLLAFASTQVKRRHSKAKTNAGILVNHVVERAKRHRPKDVSSRMRKGREAARKAMVQVASKNVVQDLKMVSNKAGKRVAKLTRQARQKVKKATN